MKVKKGLLITLEFPPEVGGISTYLSELFRHFPHGTLRVLTAEGGAADFPHPVIRKELYFNKFWPKWLKAFLEARKILQQEPTEKIYISHVLPMGYVALLLKIFYKVPYAVFFHGMDVKLGAKSSWKKFWFKQIMLGAENLVSNSEFTKNEILKLVSPAVPDIKVINPSPKILPAKGLPKDPLNILSVGRLVARKGFDLGIAAFAKIKAALPEAQYYIVGDGPERSRLLSQIQTLNLKDSVHLLGAVPDATLSELYARASLFLFPVRESAYGDVEGFGIAPLEANTHGVPVVASRAGGISEAVAHGETAILVPPGHVEAMSVASIFILSNPSIVKTMGEAGIKWGAKFNSGHQANKLISALWP